MYESCSKLGEKNNNNLYDVVVNFDNFSSYIIVLLSLDIAA